MSKLALLTNEAIDSLLAQQKGTTKARRFLERNFEGLSEADLQALTEPISFEIVQTVDKILEVLKRDLKDLKASDLRSFVQQKFPFLDDKEQDELILELSQPLVLIPPRRPPWQRLDLLIVQALENIPLIMEKREGQKFLKEKFPLLTEDDLQWLTQPVVITRQAAMNKLMRHMGEEARDLKVGDLRKMLKAKYRNIDPEGLEDIVPEIVWGFPPRRPKPRAKPKRAKVPPRKPR